MKRIGNDDFEKFSQFFKLTRNDDVETVPTEGVKAAFNSKQKNENFTSFVLHVLQNTQNLATSRYFAEDGKEMYKGL